MRRPRHLAALACVFAATGAACTNLPADGTSTAAPIFGGTADTADGAVMALINQLSATNTGACSGTVIATSGASGVFLTAGHCVVANDGMGHVTTPLKVSSPDNLFIVPGPDWAVSTKNGQYYGVGQVVVHPQYDGSVESPFDVALVRFLGALPSTPVIPVLDAASDKLAAGSTITVVGFGETETNTMNTQRLEVDRAIASITANQFLYDQTDRKGACSGDSGGPALVQTPTGLRVGGTTSFGDPDCIKDGASVRVSAVAASFIQPFINGLPKTLSCDECALGSVAPGNACINQSIACGPPTSTCAKFVGCMNGCTSQACVTQCERSNPSGASAYQAIVSCQCGGMCATACANNQVCGGSGTGAAGSGGTGAAGSSGGAGALGPPGSGAAGTSGGSFACQDFVDSRPACQTCMQTSCCAQATACAGDPTCTSCLIDSSSPACAADAAFASLSQCEASCSGAPCSKAAGLTGAGGTTPAAAAKTGCSCDVGSGGSSRAGLGALLALALVASRRPRRR